MYLNILSDEIDELMTKIVSVKSSKTLKQERTEKRSLGHLVLEQANIIIPEI